MNYDDGRGDAAGYDAVARALLSVQTFADLRVEPLSPSFYRGPGYAVFVAFIYALGGGSVVLLRAAQALLSTFVVVILGLSVGKFSRKAGVTLAWLLALSPFEAVYSGALLSECLATTLLVCALCVPMWRRDTWAAMVCGIVLGLLCLTREVFLLLVPLAALVYPAMRKPWRKRAAVIAGVVITLAPWTYRNYRLTQRFIPVSEGRLGYSLWLGTWALNGDFTAGDADGLARIYPDNAFASPNERARVEALLHTSNDREMDAGLRDVFVSRLRDHSGAVVTTWLRRLPRLWIATRFDIFEFKHLMRGTPLWWVVKVALLAIDTLWVVLGVGGLVLAMRWRALYLWWALPMVYVTAVFTPLNSFESRYSQPVMAVAAVFAVLCGAKLWRSARSQWSAS
jgi:hypothetical protein